MRKSMFFLAGVLLFAGLSGELMAQGGTVGGDGPPPTSSAILDANLVAAAGPTASSPQVSQAIDNIFALSGLSPSVADAYSITSQIAASQVAYNAGNYANLSEANVVTALNNFVTAWGLPSYALTSVAEVKQLHISLIIGSPRYMLGGANGQPGTTGLVRTSLSPLEATFLFSTLVHQKLSNPLYQMTASQFAAYNAAIAAGQTPPALVDQSAALNAAVQSTAVSKGALAVMLQLNQTMTDLGVIGGAQ
jgi:hypothetical protein